MKDIDNQIKKIGKKAFRTSRDTIRKITLALEAILVLT
jgi:hypothetical protein